MRRTYPGRGRFTAAAVRHAFAASDSAGVPIGFIIHIGSLAIRGGNQMPVIGSRGVSRRASRRNASMVADGIAFGRIARHRDTLIVCAFLQRSALIVGRAAFGNRRAHMILGFLTFGAGNRHALAA